MRAHLLLIVVLTVGCIHAGPIDPPSHPPQAATVSSSSAPHVFSLQGVLTKGAGTGPIAGGPSVTHGETSGESTLDFGIKATDSRAVAVLKLNSTATPADVEVAFLDPSKQVHRTPASFDASTTKTYTFEHPESGTWQAEIDPRAVDADVGFSLLITVT